MNLLKGFLRQRVPPGQSLHVQPKFRLNERGDEYRSRSRLEEERAVGGEGGGGGSRLGRLGRGGLHLDRGCLDDDDGGGEVAEGEGRSAVEAGAGSGGGFGVVSKKGGSIARVDGIRRADGGLD